MATKMVVRAKYKGRNHQQIIENAKQLKDMNIQEVINQVLSIWGENKTAYIHCKDWSDNYWFEIDKPSISLDNHPYIYAKPVSISEDNKVRRLPTTPVERLTFQDIMFGDWVVIDSQNLKIDEPFQNNN